MIDVQYINAESVRRVCRVFVPQQQYFGGELILDFAVPAAVSTLKPYSDWMMCKGFRLIGNGNG